MNHLHSGFKNDKSDLKKKVEMICSKEYVILIYIRDYIM